MSNADYKNSGYGPFASFVKTDAAIGFLDSTIDYTEFNFAVTDAFQPGMAAMWDDEIIRIETVGIRTFTCKGGCADTVPTQHAAGSIIWLLSGSVGSDQKERSAGQTVAVKESPYTVGGGNLPIATVAPDEVTFNWRFFRPYPPAQMKANTAAWYSGAAINDTTGSMNLTWVDRNRVTQADQLLGHDDAGMTPEPNTTYALRIYKPDGTLLREEPGIRGNAFMYQHSKALKDFGYPSSAVDGFATFTTERDGVQSYTGYVIPMHVEPSASPITPVWADFWQLVIETPYVYNARHGYGLNEGRGLAMAARPGDRMSDGYNLCWHWWTTEDSGTVDGNGNPIYVQVEHNAVLATGDYTPWFTLEFGITELETTINVAESSLWQGGVRVPDIGSLVGKIALINEELVIFKELHGDVYTIGRGVGDTIPARHIAGTGVVMFDNVGVVDPSPHVVGEQVDFRFQPLTYGSLPDINALPARNVLRFNSRALRPYNVGQLVVGGRPWYEEAQVTSGLPLNITWAWRNRVTQGANTYDHAYPTIPPEAGAEVVVEFYYETPSPTPGGPPTEHPLRAAYVTPQTVGGVVQDGFYSYPYAFAQADGNVAGRALGICGTVVIYCRIMSIREGYSSWHNYRIPIRVPSYPC